MQRPVGNDSDRAIGIEQIGNRLHEQLSEIGQKSIGIFAEPQFLKNRLHFSFKVSLAYGHRPHCENFVCNKPD